MLILVKNDQANIRKTRDASTTAVANAEQSAGPQGEALRSGPQLRADRCRSDPPSLPPHTHTLTLTLTLALALASSPSPSASFSPSFPSRLRCARSSRMRSAAACTSGRPGSISADEATAAAAAAAANGLTAIERGATLFDPSAAISLLWLRRSLKFTIVLLEHLARPSRRQTTDARSRRSSSVPTSMGRGRRHAGAGEQLTLYMLHITCFHM